MNYYGIKREIFKGNKTMPEETTIYPELYKTEEEAVKAMLHEADSSCMFYHYEPVIKPHQAYFDTAIQTVHNSKTGKDTIYRHEWSIIKFNMEEEQ